MKISPPKDLADREPLIFWAQDSDVWYRSHQIDQPPVFFGKTMSCRWDAPHGEYGVLYLAADRYEAFMETIGRFELHSRLVGEARLRSKGISVLRFNRELKLIDLVSSSGLTRIGAEASLSRACPV